MNALAIRLDYSMFFFYFLLKLSIQSFADLFLIFIRLVYFSQVFSAYAFMCMFFL